MRTLPRTKGARKILGRWQTWAGFGVAAVVLFAVAPAVLSDFRLSLLGKFLCYAIVAVGIGLAWGRSGMLVLGQGVFFGIGGYMMGMHLKIADAQLRGDDVPDFMQIAGVRELPAYWEPFASPAFTLLAIVLVPTAIAAALGLGVFKRRVKGACFAILSQALAAALAILLGRSDEYRGQQRAQQVSDVLRLHPDRSSEPADAVFHRRGRPAARGGGGASADAEPLRRVARRGTRR